MNNYALMYTYFTEILIDIVYYMLDDCICFVIAGESFHWMTYISYVCCEILKVLVICQLRGVAIKR